MIENIIIAMKNFLPSFIPLQKELNMVVSKKKIVIIIICFLSIQTLSAQDYYNRIGFEYGGYIVSTPRNNLPGNKYNQYMVMSSSLIGLYYERLLNDTPFGLKTGVYLNKQFNSIISVQVPVEFNGNIFGRRYENGFYAGYSAGLNFNFVSTVVSGYITVSQNNIVHDYIDIKKNFYLSPDVGVIAGVNLNRISLTAQCLFNFLIPEFVTYKTVYKNDQNKEVTEYNTNNNWGITFRFGLAYRL